MRSMPLLQYGSTSYALPLAERTALALMSALVEDGLPQRLVRLKSCASADPALLLWAVCRAHQQGQELTSLEVVAEWFSRRLSGEVANSARPEPISDQAAQSMRELAASSSAIAAASEAIARAEGADIDGARLLGLLHAAGRWLELAQRGEQHADTCALLPQWLRESLRQLDSDLRGHDESPAVNIVRRARSNSATVSMAGDALSEHWPDCGEQAAFALSNLCQKLLRLGALERDFARAVQTARLEAMKELAYGAGHEINNPLANISARAQTLLAEERDPERRRKLAAINTQAFRAHEMIADMMLFARPPQLKPGEVNLCELLARITQDLQARALEQRTGLTFERLEQPLTIRADAVQLTVAIAAVCVNALEALREGGRIDVHVHPLHHADYVAELVVADDGPGIPAEVRPRLFDPFFSGREAGRGLGMGLAKCWRIVTSHGGEIAVEDRSPRGTIFRIRLRREPPPS